MDEPLTPELAKASEESELYGILYHVLAASAGEDDWEHGRLVFEVLAPDVTSSLYVTVTNGIEKFGAVPGRAHMESDIACWELARRMEAAGHPAWSQLTFETNRAGEISVSFRYDDEPDSADQ